jgi:hypothetical protein
MGYALRRIRLRGGSFAMESVATLPWDDRQLCDGISGNFAVESMATFARNTHPLAPRGCRGPRGCKGPVLFQRLERPHPDTLGHPAPGDGRRFDGFA